MDHLLPVFSEVYTEKQQQKYAEGVASGARTRKPGGGAKGKRRTMGDKLLFVLYTVRILVGEKSASVEKHGQVPSGQVQSLSRSNIARAYP